VAIVSGFVVVFGLLTAKRLDGWTALFLATTVATSVTGFLFPFHRFMSSHAVGIVSLLVLPVAIFALYRRRLVGYWRPVYVVAAMLALYLNVFVLVAQAFLKVPALKATVPTQSRRHSSRRSRSCWHPAALTGATVPPAPHRRLRQLKMLIPSWLDRERPLVLTFAADQS
jgi:hypothetical protein